MRWRSLLLVLLAAPAAPACGDDGGGPIGAGQERLSAEEFSIRAEAICRKATATYQAEAAKVEAQLDEAGDDDAEQQRLQDDFVRLLTEVFPATLTTMLDDLDELRPPEASERDFDAMVAAGRKYVERISEPIGPDQQAKLDDASGTQFEDKAEALGLKACVGVGDQATEELQGD